MWTAPATDARLKKRIVRTVIREAIADLDDATSEIVITIHWVGGGIPNTVCRDAVAGSATARQPTSLRRLTNLPWSPRTMS